MKKVVINGSEIASEQQLHKFIAENLELPEWYGGNFDALFDCLTDITDEVEIAIAGSDDLIDKLGERALIFLTVLRDASAESSNIKITVEN